MHCKFSVDDLSKFTRSSRANMSEYKAYSKMLIDVQSLLERSAPSFETYHPWIASVSASELPEEYANELKEYREKPFLSLEKTKLHEGTMVRIPINNKPQMFTIRKLFVDDPSYGCSGIVLETDKLTFVVFRSATHTSTFMKVGASSLLQSPKILAPGVQCNAYLGNHYNKHFSAPLAAILQSQPDKQVLFLGYSMGAALGQLAMYDMIVRRGIPLRQKHLFLASPRMANHLFYEHLSARGVRIRNIVAATRLKGDVYLDPVPLLRGFSDPPVIYLLGQLFEPGISWHGGVVPTAGTKLNVIETSDAFKDHFKCHAVSILSSYMQTAFGESSMDLHGSYCVLVCNGTLI